MFRIKRLMREYVEHGIYDTKQMYEIELLRKDLNTMNDQYVKMAGMINRLAGLGL